MKKEKTILLLGGCGYIGTPLAESLLQEGHKVIVVDIMWFGNYLKPHPNLTVICEDIRNIDRLPMKGVDVIIHLANIANDPCGDLNSKLTWEVNVLATMQLVEKAIREKVPQFIFASSGSVYGIKEEELVTEELSLVPISDYNKTKMISERVLLSYKDQIVVNIVRPATVCGYSPRMRLDLSVNILTFQALVNKQITVFGGKQTRPNIHLKDMVRLYLHFVDRGKNFPGIYNAGFENLSIFEIAKQAAGHTSAEIAITPSNDPRSYRLSSQKLLSTGFVPKYTVQDGMQEVIAAFKQGLLKEDERYHNVKWMQKIQCV